MSDETAGAVVTQTKAVTKKARKAPRRITDNRELVAIDRVIRFLSGLDIATQARVIDYVGRQVYAQMTQPVGLGASTGAGSVASGRELIGQ